ncbi:MAG TPA: threonine--tRNA ligase [Candidatus Gracilibacteria bacterium]
MCNTCDDLELRRRHTGSHILSYAVGLEFGEVKRGVGPWTDTGFYQDFDFGDREISDKDFKKIEKKMRWIVNKDFKVVREIVSPQEARKVFAHDEYKIELIDEIVARGEELTFHNFVDDTGRAVYQDLCAGPHLESTGQIGAFKLMKLAGAYWRGDSDKATLIRIYGVAYKSQEDLEAYLHLLEEAAKRDHRKLGAELDLFTFSDLVGPGLPLYTPKGTFMREKVTQILHDLKKEKGYEFVWIPHITKKDLYVKSGHWDKYKDDLFHVHGKGDTEFVMKPMNCPHHAQIYASKMRSYRDLPVRIAETTTCYRDELPGELMGLSRVRSFTQDDTHLFVRMSQIKEEARGVVDIIRQFYTRLEMFGEDNYWVSLSVRDPQTLDKYLGDNKNWDLAEQFLEEIAQEEALPYKRVEGEAAFYGPKLDFQFKDAIGREWQLATLQIDFVQPERFELEYVNEKGERERPVMIHIAIAGSLDRFLSVMIEHFAGAFPAWLAPVQCHILPVNEAHDEYAATVLQEVESVDGRAELYESTESLGKRIRNCQTAKVPFAVVLGDKEQEEKSVTIRKYGEQKDETMTLESFLALLKD